MRIWSLLLASLGIIFLVLGLIFWLKSWDYVYAGCIQNYYEPQFYPFQYFGVGFIFISVVIFNYLVWKYFNPAEDEERKNG